MNTKLNKSDIIVLGIYFLISIAMQTIDYYKNDSSLIEYLFDFPSDIITNSSIVILFVFWLIPKFITSKKFILFTFLGLSILIFFGAIDYLVGFWSGNNDWTKMPTGLDFILKMIDRATNASAFPFALLLGKKFYEGQTEFLKIEKQQKENELKLLRSQIDPHFLFNNLNTLDSLIDSNPKKAKEYINRLSLIYRYLIQTKDSEVMELSEEINLAENYIFLIKTRFGDDYNFIIEKNTSIDDKFIPTGALQTLLENVVKHNKRINTAIKAVINIDDDSIKITNSKSTLKPKNESFGTGLENLKTRYKHLSNKEVITINSQNEFKVILPIIHLSK